MTEKFDDTSRMYDIEHEYYDILFRDLDHDFDFYLGMARSYGHGILECMCGTGRILLHMARNGFDIDGFDLNDSMLARARGNIGKEPEAVRNRINIWKGDLRNFDTGKKYNLIIIPFSSFLHILGDGDRLRAMVCLKKALSENGVLIIDIFNPDLTRPEKVLRFEGDSVKHIPETGDTLMRFYSQKFNRENKTIIVQFIYDLMDNEGNIKRKLNEMEIAYMFHGDMKALAERSGFSTVCVYGNHDMSDFTEKSPHMIWVLKH